MCRVGHCILEATQGQINGFFSQLPYKCHLEEVTSVSDLLKICPRLDSRVGVGFRAARTAVEIVARED